jgi:predicted DNA-binding transcriptional regulator AlpA
MDRVRLSTATASPLEVVRKRPLAKKLDVSPWTIDRWRADPDSQFPQPLWLSPTTPVWRVVEVEHWLSTRPKGGLSPVDHAGRPPAKRGERRRVHKDT